MDKTSDQVATQDVQWGPDRRTGAKLETIPMHGETWSRVRSEGWHERLDLPGFYQREAVQGLTKPCELVLREKDIEPAAPAAPKSEFSAGLREDVASALKTAQDLHDQLTGGQRQAAAALERLIRGIQAAVKG